MIDYSVVLPDFPRTKHLPWKPNAQRDDLIATEAEAAVLFRGNPVHVTEKVDGANIGITVINGEPLIRNRNHVLRKSHAARTAAKAQFNPVWNWFYENVGLFEALAGHGQLSVYGEWLLAVHTIKYDSLPDFFAAFDLWDQETRTWLDPFKAERILHECGFPTVPFLVDRVDDPKQLESMMDHRLSKFASYALREGIYLKLGNGERLTHRFKMVRTGFIAGEHWSKQEITKNRKLKP